MPLFSPAIRDAMSSWCERVLFNTDCDIMREQVTPTPSGGEISVWAVAATVRCVMVNMMTPPHQQAIATQETGIMDKIVGMPIGTDIRKDDRLRVNGVIFAVIDLYGPSSYEVMTTVLAQRTTLP